MTTTLMIDAIGASAANIPAATPKVAGYVTGIGTAIAWTAADWGRFPRAGHVLIDQDANASDPLGSDVLDVEGGAAAAVKVPGWVKTRIAHGIQWSTVYGTDATLAAVQSALEAAGAHGWYFGHVDCWLADWNLSEAAAAALIGREVHGLTCRAVQWASPTSNPGTLVPGGTLTLRQANVDLSVTEAAWHAYAAPKPPAPVPAAYGLLVTRLPGAMTGPVSRSVKSTDGGRTWS